MLLEATPPYELPRPETETLTADLLQLYVEKLGKYTVLGHDDTPTLAGLWSFIVDQLGALISIIYAFITQHFLLLTLMAVSLLSCWLLYRTFRNEILAWRLYWHVKRHQQTQSPHDAVFYMQHIHQLLQLRNQPRLPGDSIESFCLHPALQGVDKTSLKSLSEQINKCFYKNKQTVPNGELFKTIFFYVYNRK